MGRKPALKGAYEGFAGKLRELGLTPPPFKACRQTPPSVRSLLCEMLEKKGS